MTPTLSVSNQAATARPAPTLRAEHITSGYGGVPVVRDVSIDVGPGEVVAIIGPNGAGKSTLLKSLVGILRVTEGHILLGRDDVTNHAPEELARRGVGYVPQVNDIFEPLTVYENLEMGGYLLKSDQIKRRADEVMAVFPQLPPMLKRRADKLSGGERKMLAIARAGARQMSGNPFFAAEAPAALYIAWVVAWIGAVLAGTVWSFTRREI